MKAFLQRRKESSPAAQPLAEAPAGPITSAAIPLHAKAQSLPAVISAASEWAEARAPVGTMAGGAPSRSARSRAVLKWAILAALALLFLMRSPQHQGFTHTRFITIEGTQFMLDCRPFFIAGFNVETVGELARQDFLGGGFKAAGQRAGAGRQAVRALFEQATAAGLNVVRLWAHTTDRKHPLQVEPGVYDEAVFRGLDVVIAEAERAGLRVILSLADNWKFRGGVDEYVDWSPSVPARDERFPMAVDSSGDVSYEGFTPEQLAYENERKAAFFTDDGCRRMYKNHMRAVLERVNRATGRAYRDDPTIMAFNLLNEPRCSAYETRECPQLVNKWVLEMAQHFKTLDQKHLLTLGSEGFWGETDEMRTLNPGMPSSDWAAKSGQDFIANHGIPQIDFASIHLWSDNWANHNATFHQLWVDQHTEDCRSMLKKPCLLEEFGKRLEPAGIGREAPAAHAIASHRDPLYASVFALVERGIGQGRAMGGAMYWRWGLDALEPRRVGEYGVLPTHSTFKIITQHAQRVKAFTLAAPPAKACASECWVPASSWGGLLRRCEHRPSVCADHAARRQYMKPPRPDSPDQLPVNGLPVFASQVACCLPGLGGFYNGCSTWF